MDIILQSIGRNGTKDISFTVDKNKMDDAIALLLQNAEMWGASNIVSDDNVTKVSIVGAGMAHNAGVACKMFEALFSAGINIHMLSTSEIKISVLVDEREADRAVQAIHDQGGITVLAHPYQNKRSGSLEPFRPILDDIDAVETWNSRANRKYPHANDNAFILALMRDKLSTGGSDAHVPQEVGRGFLTVDVEERTLTAVKAQILGGYKPEGGRYWGHGKPSSARYVASSQRTKLRKAHAGAGAYAKWGLFSLNCLRQDAARTLRELKQKLPARLPKEFREIEKELDDLDDGDDPLL